MQKTCNMHPENKTTATISLSWSSSLFLLLGKKYGQLAMFLTTQAHFLKATQDIWCTCDNLHYCSSSSLVIKKMTKYMWLNNSFLWLWNNNKNNHLFQLLFELRGTWLFSHCSWTKAFHITPFVAIWIQIMRAYNTSWGLSSLLVRTLEQS